MRKVEDVRNRIRRSERLKVTGVIATFALVVGLCATNSMKIETNAANIAAAPSTQNDLTYKLTYTDGSDTMLRVEAGHLENVEGIDWDSVSYVTVID